MKCAEPDGTMDPRLAERGEKGERAQLTDIVSGRCACEFTCDSRAKGCPSTRMITPKPLIIIIWTCQEMMVWMRMELFGSPDVIMLNFALWKMMRKFHEFYPSLITNLTQHDSHERDDHPKTIDLYNLDMS